MSENSLSQKVDSLISLLDNPSPSVMINHDSNDSYFIGVDCGTGSVRAALISETGVILCQHSAAIETYNPKKDFYEQSSDDIWSKTCECVRHIVEHSQISKNNIKGIGFDATCSLVALDKNNNPTTISPTNDSSHNIILWMDHRATSEADHINKSGFKDILSYVGGTISPEAEIPKILWCKKNLSKKVYTKIEKFMDLADFLTYKATDNDVRSLCTVACKWTFRSYLYTKADRITTDNNGYMDAKYGWDTEFFRYLGLEDLGSNNFSKIGSKVAHLGTPIVGGLSDTAAKAMGGLPSHICVSVGMIDAHCGALGLLGATNHASISNIPFHNRIALISGTSTCHMMPILNEVFVSGVWGPFYSALTPQLWLLEGGQSATGALIDYIIRSVACYPQIESQSKQSQMSVYQFLNYRLHLLAKQNNMKNVSFLSKELHINPYFHGNRSPLADPNLKGMISGLKLGDFQNIDNTAILYLATLQSLCYDSKSIIDTIVATKKVTINAVFCTGGLSKNPLFVELHSDITGIPMILPRESDSVLVGGGVLALTAFSNGKLTVENAMKQMNYAKSVIEPNNDATIQRYHCAKYKVFQKMIADFKSYQTIMSTVQL